MKTTLLFFCIILFIIDINILYATDYIQAHNVTINATSTDALLRSQVIMPKVDLTIKDVHISNLSNATQIVLYNASVNTSYVILTSCSIVDYTCNLNYNLYAGVKYILSANKGANITHVQAYGRPVSNPVNISDSYIYWLDATFWSSGVWSGSFGNYITNVVNLTITPFVGTPPIVFYLTTNLINNTININEKNILINYNGSVAYGTTNYFNCSLYDNITLLNFSDSVNITQNNSFNYTFGSVEKTFLFKINCSNFETNGTTGFYNYKVDTIKPVIESSFLNNSNYTQLELFVFYYNASDTNLYAVNKTYYDINGNIVFYNFNLTSTFFQQQDSFILANIGNFSIKIQAWDSHTSDTIEDYEIENGNNYTKIAGIKFYGNDIKKFIPVKLKNSYNFIIEYNENTTDKTIYIYSDTNLTIINDSRYIGHIIDFEKKKWIDFESSDLEDVKLKQESINEIRVNFKVKKDKTIIKSIGDLNYEEKIYYYQVKALFLNTSAEHSDNVILINKAINMAFYGLLLFIFVLLAIFINPLFLICDGIVIIFIGLIDSNAVLSILPDSTLWLRIVFYGAFSIMFIIFGVALYISKMANERKNNGFYEGFYK